MNKIKLIETVTRGSHIRKTVDPGLILGNEDNGYLMGDILDANATVSASKSLQKQADWNQTDNTEKDYIKNKPDLTAMFAEKQDAPAVAGTDGQILSLNSQGEPTWINPVEGSVIDNSMSDISENPVQNKVIKEYVDDAIAESGVYDVTANNDNTKFASLSALLSSEDLDTLIPSAKRKGGMSIKFILDNSDYSVVKEEGLETAPTGTLITSNPSITNGTYKASQLVSTFATLPTSTGVGNAVVYYKEVSGESTTYTSWTITLQSSDNKYVQFRCMANAFTTNIDDWSFCPNNTLIESGKYLKVYTDNNGFLLCWLNKDGSVDWAVGVPTPVKTYVDTCIATILNGSAGTTIDGLNKVIAFLDGFTTSDILAEIVVNKVDKEDNKSLIPDQYIKRIENYVYLWAITDNNNKLLAAIKRNGCHLMDSAEVNEIKVQNSLLLSDTALKNFKALIGIDYIKTDDKNKEFCELFKNATGNVESFVFFSDPHWFTSYNQCDISDISLGHLKVIKDTFDNTPTDFVICGGDWLNNHKQSIAIQDLGWIDGFMNNLFPDKYYPVFGNHDNNYQGELDDTESTSANDGILSNQQMINLWFRKYGKMYYSFKGSNTKFFVFDTGIDWVTAMDSYRWGQVEWFANELLTNQDEHIMLALHIVTNSGTVFGENVAPLADNILLLADAFNNKRSITLNEVSYDFTNAIGTVHAAICGHTHYDAIDTINNIPVFCIDSASNGNFDAILIDYGTAKLKSIRFGTGMNREMNLV